MIHKIKNSCVLSECNWNAFWLNYSLRYDISNCYVEAVLQKIEEDCECVPSYYEETAPDVKICTGPSINCMNQLKDKIGSIKFIKDNGYYRDEPMKFITNKGWYILPVPKSLNQTSFTYFTTFCTKRHFVMSQ